MTELTTGQIIAEMRRLAAENPDNTAECRYLSDYDTTIYNRFRDEDDEDDQPYIEPDPEAKPICIVGTAVFNLFEDKDQVKSVLRECEDHGSNDVLEHLDVEHYYIGDKAKQSNWIEKAQAVQDSGRPWAEAVRQADATYPDLKIEEQRNA